MGEAMVCMMCTQPCYEGPGGKNNKTGST